MKVATSDSNRLNLNKIMCHFFHLKLTSKILKVPSIRKNRINDRPGKRKNDTMSPVDN